MDMGPERREQDQLALFRHDLDVLDMNLCFPTRAIYIVQVPNRYQLTLAEFARAAVNVPVIILTRPGTLEVVAHIPPFGPSADA